MTTSQSPWAGAIPAVVYVILVAAACAGWQLFAARSAIPPTLDPASVAEPVAFISGDHSDFDGIWMIIFRNASGVDWRVDLLEGEGYAVIRRGEAGWRLPIAGPEEKTLLGFFERWAAADPEARRIAEGGEIPEGAEDKAVGIDLLRRLRLRNE